MPTFEDLLAPTSIDDFLADYWEAHFFHGTSPAEPFDSLFSVRDIERWVRSTREGFFFVLHPEGDSVQIASFPASSVEPGVLARNYENGLAQIMKMARDWPALQGFVSHLEAFFHASVHVNVFLTPAGAQPHPIYTCNDNILVLQLEGEQTWELRELRVLQLDLPEKQHLEFSDQWKHRQHSPVLDNVRLRAGEVLYIPRGMPHFAQAPDQGLGLQLRIYITPLTWVDVFKMAAEHAAIHSPSMRRSLTPGFVENDASSYAMAIDFEQLMGEFQNLPFDDVLSAVRRNRVAHQGIPATDFRGRAIDLEAITTDSKLERRPHVLCTVETIHDADGQVKSALFFGKDRVNGPTGLQRAFEFIRARKDFRVSELPGLDAKSQLLLARRLVREGLLLLTE